MSTHRKFLLGRDRANGLGLALLLLIAVLAPTICLLWFMNRAAQNEGLALRQRLAEAYRAQLALAQDRIEAHWQQTSRTLEQEADKMAPPELFARLVRSGETDAAIIYQADGTVAYPTIERPSNAGPVPTEFLQAQELEANSPAAAAQAFAKIAKASTNADRAARALQAQARCLLAAGEMNEALILLSETLAQPEYRNATDFQGRLIAPNAQLLALERLQSSAPQRATALFAQLSARVQDYTDSALASPQRRFLMHELQRLFHDQASFPTLVAEDLAARYLETGMAGSPPRSGLWHEPGPEGPGAPPSAEPRPHGLNSSTVLIPAPLPGVWQFTTTSRRVVLLHETSALAARLKTQIAPPSGSSPVAALALLPPGREPAPSALTQAAGPSLPGWRLQIAAADSPALEAAAKEKVAVYIWVGVLVIVFVLSMAVLALGLVRRQVALTQLRNDLVANVTHELKTPLASMRLLVDTLLDSQPLHEQTAREYLELIARENLRLSRLIENFLAFSRMERNKYALNFRTVDPADIVAGARAAVQERFNQPGCRFDVKSEDVLPTVEADPDAIVTALVNLLDNAYKYSGEDKQITLSAGATNGHLNFQVADNGIGLSPRETKRIFKRFYRVHQPTSTCVTGCGLGLSIVQHIVTAHHGSVRVDSQPGRGSTFTISLPAKTTPANQEVL